MDLLPRMLQNILLSSSFSETIVITFDVLSAIAEKAQNEIPTYATNPVIDKLIAIL